jgi:hypothetical protein
VTAAPASRSTDQTVLIAPSRVKKERFDTGYPLKNSAVANGMA